MADAAGRLKQRKELYKIYMIQINEVAFLRAFIPDERDFYLTKSSIVVFLHRRASPKKFGGNTRACKKSPGFRASAKARRLMASGKFVSAERQNDISKTCHELFFLRRMC